MGSYEETMTDFGVRFRGEVIGLVVEVLVSLLTIQAAVWSQNASFNPIWTIRASPADWMIP